MAQALRDASRQHPMNAPQIQHARHVNNVPGDFYVEDGCCTSCEIPFVEAPGHFAFGADGHCYVCKQPSTPQEADGMVHAAEVSELHCIRYAGSDPDILKKLIAVKRKDLCDVLQQDPEPAAQQTPARAAGTRKVWWAVWRR